jgi:ribosomal protein S18 acetylase RimI-like enzyme
MNDSEDLAPEPQPGPPITFLRIGAEDLERLAPLWESMRSYYMAIAPELPTYSAEESWARRAEQYRHLLDHEAGVIVALLLDDELTAYAATRPAETSSVFAWSERAAELETLVVARSARGRGLGHLLLDHVRSQLRAQGFDELTLHVVVTNEPALAFYKQAGFRPYLVMLSDAIPASE